MPYKVSGVETMKTRVVVLKLHRIDELTKNNSSFDQRVDSTRKKKQSSLLGSETYACIKQDRETSVSVKEEVSCEANINGNQWNAGNTEYLCPGLDEWGNIKMEELQIYASEDEDCKTNTFHFHNNLNDSNESSVSHSESLDTDKFAHNYGQHMLSSSSRTKLTEPRVHRDESFSTSSPRRHMGTKHGKNTYKCARCEKSFSCPSHLRRHERSHTGERPFKCDLCGKFFSRRYVLKEHQNKHAGVEKSKHYNCDCCNKSFDSRWRLSEHLRIHTKEKPYNCQLCKKKFSQLNGLKSHMRQHVAIPMRKPKCFECRSCGKTFSGQSFKYHQLIHTGERPHKCGKCGKSFSRSGTLNRHLRTHTKVKPYMCNQCDKSFTRRSTLTTHQRTHSGERPFDCEHCGKDFAVKSILKTHLRIHSGESPYKCDKCAKAFTDYTSLKYHFKKHLRG